MMIHPQHLAISGFTGGFLIFGLTTYTIINIKSQYRWAEMFYPCILLFLIRTGVCQKSQYFRRIGCSRTGVVHKCCTLQWRTPIKKSQVMNFRIEIALYKARLMPVAKVDAGCIPWYVGLCRVSHCQGVALLACTTANTDERSIKHRTYDIVVNDTPDPRRKIGILSMKPDTPSHIIINVKPLHAIITSRCRTGHGCKVIGHKETHDKRTQKYELWNIYRATHQSLNATTRSVLSRQHKEQKHILFPTLKETTTRLLHHGKHRNWWTSPRNSNNLPTIWYEYDGMRSHPPSLYIIISVKSDKLTITNIDKTPARGEQYLESKTQRKRVSIP